MRPGDVAATARQACRIAAVVGYPVRLTLVAPGVAAASVSSRLGCPAEVRCAFDAVIVEAYRRAPAAQVHGVRVEPDA